MPHALLLAALLAAAPAAPSPPPAGRLVDLGGHRLHVHCTGRGAPTVVVEGGFDELSSDWAMVQSRVAAWTRVCTYDRAGYGSSDPGPQPRTFAQIGLELRAALAKLGERGPFVLAGHSFGGPAARYFAATYRDDVAGLVLVESAHEDQRVPIQGKAVRLRESAEGRAIPEPHMAMVPSDKPPAERTAEARPGIDVAEDSERTWSPEYFALWSRTPQDGSLGTLPLIVLTRAEGGYGDDLDVPGAELEAERKDQQARLARLSTRGEQRIVQAGHDMQREAPDVVAKAIEDVVRQARAAPSAPRVLLGQ